MFEFFGKIFYLFLYKPLLNSLVILYNYLPFHDLGIAIIFLTILVRVILYPLSVKAFESQKNLQKLQPQIKEIQKKYKDDKEKQAQEILELYKKEKINPLSSLLLTLIQIPILLALYKVFWVGSNTQSLPAFDLYPFVSNPQHFNSLFIGIIDLSKPNFFLAILAGLSYFFQSKMVFSKKKNKISEKENSQDDFSQIFQKQSLYFFPFLTTIILFKLPSALGLYWATSTFFSIIQQYITLRKEKEN